MVKDGYKQSEIGILPKDWEIKKIEDLTNCSAGATPSTSNKDFWGGNIKWMNSGELNLKIIFDVEGRITEHGLKNSSTKLIPKDCILMGLAGQGKTRGTVAINKVPLCTNQSIAAIYPNERYVSKYLYYNLESRYNELRAMSTGDGGRGGLNLTIIRNILLAYPKIEEQQEIAKALGDIDELIVSLEKLISKKEAIKQGTMQQLLTGKKRLKEFTEKWKEIKLEDIAIFLKGKGLPKSQLSSDGRYKCIHYGELFTKYREVITKVGNFTNNYDSPILSMNNDVLMPTSDVTPKGLATASCIKQDGIILGGDILVIRVDNSILDGRFLAFYITIDKNQVLQLVSGTTVFHLYGSDMANFTLSIPSIKEQQLIVEILSNMDEEIISLKSKLSKTKAIKNGMMSELLTGKTRLAKKEPKANKHNKHFEDAVIIGVLSNMFSTQKFPMGRKRYTKLSYLLHRKKEHTTEQYLKKAAGPYNPTTRYGGAEKIAVNKKYVKEVKSGKYTGFVSDENADEAKEYFFKWFGYDMSKWIEQFKYYKNDQLELLATVDMAMQDLIKSGKSISLESIKNIIESNDEWKPKLKREVFNDSNIEDAIKLSSELFKE